MKFTYVCHLPLLLQNYAFHIKIKPLAQPLKKSSLKSQI